MLAYPDLADDARDAIIKPLFLRGVLKHIKDVIKYREFGSLEEAIKTTVFWHLGRGPRVLQLSDGRQVPVRRGRRRGDVPAPGLRGLAVLRRPFPAPLRLPAG